MILVILGTQDKKFNRLLEAVDKQIKKGNIKDKVVVQAGSSDFKSKDMEIFDYIPMDKFEEYIKKADLVITHGGVGSIINSLKHDKKVIAAARLKEFGEHENDHQKQIISEFKKDGYILELSDFDKLDEVIEKSKKFKPKKYEGNNKKMLELVDSFIESSNNKPTIIRPFIAIFAFILLVILLLV